MSPCAASGESVKDRDYPLSRLTMAVDELNRLTQKQVPDAIARIRTDLDNDEYTNAGIEAAHRLRLLQADYIRLAAELDAASRSFRLMEQGLRRQIDAALADWELRFAGVPRTAPPGRQGGLRGLLRLGRTRTPPSTQGRDIPPQQRVAPSELPDPAPGPGLADEFPPPPPRRGDRPVVPRPHLGHSGVSWVHPQA